MQVFKLMPLIIRIATVLFLALLPTGRSSGQSGTGTLHGQVIDPSGAAVPGATVEVTASGGQTSTAKTGKDGAYEVKALAPGKYTVKASAKGFQTYQAPEVQVGAGRSQKQDLPLAIEVKQQKVEVTENGTQLDVSPGKECGRDCAIGQGPRRYSRMIRTSCSRIWMHWPALPSGPIGGPDVHRRIYARDSFRPNLPSAKCASIRIPSRRNTTSSGTAGSKFSRSREPTNFMGSSCVGQ